MLQENMRFSELDVAHHASRDVPPGSPCYERVHLWKEKDGEPTYRNLDAAYPRGIIFACDFRVAGIESNGKETAGGYQWGRIVNVDHHAHTTRMQQEVTSTTLAIERVQAFGRPDCVAQIAINHTDCDSILAAAIVAGDLAPEERFGKASIAADHTGEEDEIADLLQGLRNSHDYGLSLRNLKRLLSQEPLEDAAKKALEDRKRERREAETISRKVFESVGGVSYATLEHNVDGCLFLPLLRQASAIVFVLPSKCSKDGMYRHGIKLWLGQGRPDGLTLFALRLKDSGFDPHFSGRWNAGSNCYSGGTDLSPLAYVEEIAKRIDTWVASH